MLLTVTENKCNIINYKCFKRSSIEGSLDCLYSNKVVVFFPKVTRLHINAVNVLCISTII